MKRRELTPGEVLELRRVANEYVRTQAQHMPEVPWSALALAIEEIYAVLAELRRWTPRAGVKA